MIIGTSTGQEICLIHGQVSLNLLYWKRNFQTDICGPERRLTRKQLTSRPDHLWPILWEIMEKNANLKEKQKWSHKKLLLGNARKLRGSISSTLRTRNSKKPSRMLVRNWTHLWLLLCLARHVRKASMGRPVARLMISSLILRVSWKLVNPQGCVWKNLYQNIVRTILQERVTIHCNITICTQINSYASSHEDSRSKGSSGQRMRET